METRASEKTKENYKKISELCGFDIVDYYRKHSYGSGYLRLNRKVKEPYVRNMKELARSLGMRFYVSDAHFKECSDNTCCCGLDSGWEYSRGHFAKALQIAKKRGCVHWSDIESEMGHLCFQYVLADGYNLGAPESSSKFHGLTMKEYLRYLWNSPRSGKSPYKAFGAVLRPNGFDENKDIIYI